MKHAERPATDALAARGPQGVPRRFVLGAALSGGCVAAAVALGLLGAVEVPQAESFRFSRGTQFAPGEAERLRAYLSTLAAEQDIHLRITGHTGTQGDALANQALSDDRAAAALAEAEALGIASERVEFAGGLGGAAPRPQGAEEGAREYERALARVTVEGVLRR